MLHFIDKFDGCSMMEIIEQESIDFRR